MTSDQKNIQQSAESARYALLRRLEPMLRHDLAGSLQPLTMMSMLLEKRFQTSNPDLAAALKSASQLANVAREASRDCMDLMTWLAPGKNVYVTVAAGVEDVLGLVATELAFRGFRLNSEVREGATQLPMSLIRSVFIASLLCLTDAAAAPATVSIEASTISDKLTLRLSLSAAEGEVLGSAEAAYRKIDWADLIALGNAESVGIMQSANSMELTFGAMLIRNTAS